MQPEDQPKDTTQGKDMNKNQDQETILKKDGESESVSQKLGFLKVYSAEILVHCLQIVPCTHEFESVVKTKQALLAESERTTGYKMLSILLALMLKSENDGLQYAV